MSLSQQWHALGREAELAATQIALGVTAIGRADHTRIGEYTIAFFGLAIGLERLGKLVVIADYAVGHRGKFPDNDFLKPKIAHDLGKLLDHCEVVSGTRRSTNEYLKRPNDRVHQGIIQTLSEFAMLTRYYNLDLIAGGKAAKLPEPVGAWWKRVGEPILSQHYTPRQREKDNATAEDLNDLLSPHVLVRQHSETGESTNDIGALVRRAGATRVIQKYGRLHVLQIVRWLSYTVSDLAHEAAYTHKIEPFQGLEEPFRLFVNDDRYFQNRKSWSIYY
jgi:hypothetical protein